MSNGHPVAPFYSPESEAWLWEEFLDGHLVQFAQRASRLEWAIEGEARANRWDRHTALTHPPTTFRKWWRTRTLFDETETTEERLMRWRIAVWKTIDEFKPSEKPDPPFEFAGLIGERPVVKP